MSDKIPLINMLSNEQACIESNLSNKSRFFDRLCKFPKLMSFFGSDVYQGKIYTKSVGGFFQKLRKYLSFILIGIFMLLPWFEISGRPAVLFDLEQQKFHIFSVTFWPQDAVFLIWLLVLAVFLLVAATIVIGRVWCGFTCPQTVWTFIFIWIEEKCEGDRNQRIKLDKQSWSWKKLYRKTLKHALWVLVSLVTAYTFVGYFYEIKPLVADTINFQMHSLGAFWLLILVLGTYLNAGWLREKVCLHMCPYARLQAVMYTKDTLVVTYDAQRGENRGKRKKGELENSQQGDCVDCSLCVQVCVVDIDIRDGLQYPCIDCGLCIDACDNVMEKMGLAPGLIKFSSQENTQAVGSAWLKPKALLLTVSSVIVCSMFMYAIYTRDVLSIDVIRDRSGILYQQVDSSIENTYTVKINNKAALTNSFTLQLEADERFVISSDPTIYVPRGEVDTLLVRVRINNEAVTSYKHSISFVVKSGDNEKVLARQSSSFIAPF
ncbi:MAG: cytochrome c oxidase accessory protein CcoG [Oceanospirillaceae bacterium]